MTPRVVGDFSEVHPDPAELVEAGITGIGTYVGRNRPTVEEIAAWRAVGLDFFLIFEVDDPRKDYYRIRDGEAAGKLDAPFADQRADKIGYPETAAIYYCAGDSPQVPRLSPEQILGYKRGICATTRRPVGFYGAGWVLDILDEIEPPTFRWKVDTWGDPSSADDLRQMPNLSAGVEGVDANHAIADDYGQWSAMIAPTPQEGHDVFAIQVLDTGNGLEAGQIIMVSDHQADGVGVAVALPEWLKPPFLMTSADARATIDKRALPKADGAVGAPVDPAVRQALTAAASHMQNIADVAGTAAQEILAALAALP